MMYLLRLRLSWWWLRYLRAPALALLFGVVVALVLAEVTIRALPAETLKVRLSNVLFTCYQPELPERYIYAHALAINQAVHQPKLRTECSYNGYFWQHQSDAFGWRNPETWEKVDVVLLGDSMIYGHGVEEHQTVAHFLRQELGARVANEGMMGNCPVDYLAIYRNFSLPLRPKATVMFVYFNDLDDLHGLPPEPLDRFADTGELPQARRYRREDLLSTLTYPDVPLWQRWLGRSRLYSLLRYYVPALRAAPRLRTADPGALRPLEGPDPAADLASVDFRGDPEAWFGPELGVTRRIIATMARSAAAQDSVLVVAYLPGQRTAELLEDVRIPAYLAQFAEEAGVPFFWAGGEIGNPAGTGPLPGTRLAHDGHLTELGHRLLAHDLARFLRRHVPSLRR